jgi:hypothetical protein
MIDDEPRGVTILPFSKRQASAPATPLTESSGDRADSMDLVSLLTAHIEALDRLREYAEHTHAVATSLLEAKSAGVALVVDNAADAQEVATMAAREASTASAQIQKLKLWLDHLCDQGC